MFAQDTSLAGQCVNQWKLRDRAQEATSREVANSKLRRILAHSQTFNCAEAAVGDMVLFHKTPHRKRSPRWRGPAKVLEIDETGVTVSFQSQTFKLARFRVRRRVKESEVVDQDGRVPCSTAEPWIGTWRTDKDGVQVNGDVDAPEELGSDGAGANVAPAQPQTRDDSMASPCLIPVPDSTTHGEDLELPPLENDVNDPSASFAKQCAPSQAPTMEGRQYDNLTYDELHNLCKSRGYCKKDAKTVLKTRLEAIDTVEKNSSQVQSDNMDTFFKR